MNTSALKSFAPAVRRALMEAVERKLDVVLAASTPDYRTTFAAQVAALSELARIDRAGLVERVAYTWFNRLAALRYLDARGWHPFRARVLTAAEAGSTQPELLKLAREGALPEDLKRHTDPTRLDDLLDGRLPSPNAQGEVYRHLVLAACRFYHALLPDLFERLDDATELLLPDDLLTDQSVVAGFRTAITDDDCADVEVLGWLYQFYISEKKDAVMARKAAVPSTDIPAVTQLFTPHWIVRYLVENSLGRLWLLNRPASRLRERMPYYVEAEPDAEFRRIGSPEEIRVLDPAVGSGHMLTYAFDLLFAIYEEEGYAGSEIPGLILRHNLYGIDIDPRAAQLAALALVLKARERSRRFFELEHRVPPHVIALEDVHFAPGEIDGYVRELNLGPLFSAPLRDLLTQFTDATTYGSLIQPKLDSRAFAEVRRAITDADVPSDLLLSATHAKVERVLAQGDFLARTFAVTVLNPPYLGANQMGRALKDFAKVFYPRGKSDLFAMFIERALIFAEDGGVCALVTMHGWMFLASYEKLREHLLEHTRLKSMAHIGAKGFDTIGGEVVQTTAFVLQQSAPACSQALFFRLVDGASEAEKSHQLQEALDGSRQDLTFRVPSTEFPSVPGSPLAYWVPPDVRGVFGKFPALEKSADARIGMVTGNNDSYVRLWHEVSFSGIGIGLATRDEARKSRKRWFPYAKGGPLRRWYGNINSVVDWEDDGERLQTNRDPTGSRVWAHNFNLECIFQPALCWTAIATTGTGFRFHPEGFLFDSAAGACQPTRADERLPVLGLLNSHFAQSVLELVNPTVNMLPGYIGRVPFTEDERVKRAVADVVSECIQIAKDEWDSGEGSWDFECSPLLTYGRNDCQLAIARENWAESHEGMLSRLALLEGRNNQLWNEHFGLEESTVAGLRGPTSTLQRPSRQRDAAALLSYAIGCMMGRYSLDKPGLVLADAGDSFTDYVAKVGKPVEALTFAPDVDGIIPILDGEWFGDDAVARTREFLRATFGEATLRENVRWLEESLGKDLRRYFLTDFYRDHLQTYKKRPIYWLVQSPKKGFSVLIYLHRYTRDTLNVVLNRYLREYQGKLRGRLAQLAHDLAGDALPARDRTAARKEQDRLTKVLHECEEWERQALLPLAQQRIDLDLDDGVKANYLKLADVLAPIPGLASAAN